MRLMYGTPPVRPRDQVSDLWPEAIAKLNRERAEREAFGKALFNILAPLTGEEPLP